MTGPPLTENPPRGRTATGQIVTTIQQHDELGCPNSTRRDTTAISTFGQVAMAGGSDARALTDAI